MDLASIKIIGRKDRSFIAARSNRQLDLIRIFKEFVYSETHCKQISINKVINDYFDNFFGIARAQY